MRVMLVDDEYIALEVLSKALSNYNDIKIVGSYTDPLLAISEIKSLQPDVVFLDIEMGKHNGLEMTGMFMSEKDSIEIVFVTAHSQYAVDAFELNALDYLLKPIQEKRLDKTIKRLKERIYELNIDLLTKDKLIINSFGSFEVKDNMGNQITWRTQKTKELFAYLWEQKDRPVSRDLIIETIFPDRDLAKATTILHTTIYQLRKSLERNGFSNAISFSNDSYQLIIPIISDLDEIKSLLLCNKPGDKEIRKILEIYKGDFLENESYHWVLSIQQIYKELVFNFLMNYASDKIKQGDFSSLIEICLNQMYTMDSLNDNLAKITIQYYGNTGKIFKLKTFFNNYAETLWDEMKLKPLPNTDALYRQYLGK